MNDINHLSFHSLFFYLISDSSDQKNTHRNSISSVQSHFITKNNTRVISQRGGSAVLPCSVTMSTPATVSK
jgi:hypothetical protein